MKPRNLFYSIVFTLGFATTFSHASQNETTNIINKVINAYGGQTLINAKSVKITDHNKGPWPGESENPGIPEIWRINEELTIDFVNKRKSLLSYRVPRTTIDLEKWIFDGKQGVIYDILHQRYSVQDWISFNNLGGSIVRSSDTLYARRLHSDLKQAKYLGEAFYRGRAHQKLGVTLNSGSQFTYFVDKESGLLPKVVRSIGQSKLTYVFSNFQSADGLTYASDMNFFVNDDFRLTSVFKHIELNPDLKEAFAKHDDFALWGESIDNSEMLAKRIGDGLYQAGKGRSKTVFIEQSNHFIAVGNARELKANFEELKKLTKTKKTLGYFVVTHHHRGHLAGLKDAVELGAILVTAKAHHETVSKSLANSVSNNSFLTVPDRKPFKLGSLQLFDIPTAHSQHYLLTYLPGNKSVIADEHYETQLTSSKPRIYKDMVIFGRALEALNIEVEKLIDIQSWRQLDIGEFTQWINDFTPMSCPVGYEVCAKG